MIVAEWRSSDRVGRCFYCVCETDSRLRIETNVSRAFDYFSNRTHYLAKTDHASGVLHVSIRDPMASQSMGSTSSVRPESVVNSSRGRESAAGGSGRPARSDAARSRMRSASGILAAPFHVSFATKLALPFCSSKHTASRQHGRSLGYNQTPPDYFSSCHVLQLLLPLCETAHSYRRQKLTHQQQNVLGPQARGDVYGTQGVESAASTAI